MLNISPVPGAPKNGEVPGTHWYTLFVHACNHVRYDYFPCYVMSEFRLNSIQACQDNVLKDSPPVSLRLSKQVATKLLTVYAFVNCKV